jgi:hypothetical protein
VGTYTIPEGCISLPRAYDEYLKSAYQLGSSDASDGQKANAEADLVRAFGREELVALVRRSGADAIDQIPAESWLREEWPGRSFLSPTIESVWEWSSLSGLTPFVRSEDFREWLRRHLNATEPRSVAFDGVPLDQDPMELPHWSIGITLAWIISRSPQWMKDLRNLSVAVLETSVDYSGPLSEAKGALLHALRAGELKASGKPSGQSRCEIDPMEWLDLTFQYELVEGNMVLLAVKHDREASGKWSATAYTDIRINRTAVTQREWKLRSDRTPRTAADLKTSKWIFLGQAIEWIICAGKPMPAAIVSHAWDEAERELFRVIDANGIVIEGYRSDDPARVYETLPAGIWAHMNVSDDPNSAQFNPIDDLREDGGTIWLGDWKWFGVRMEVRWLALLSAIRTPYGPSGQPLAAPAKKRAPTAGTIKRIIRASFDHARGLGVAVPSRTELEFLVKQIEPEAARQRIREVFEDKDIREHLPEKKGNRGIDYNNRSRELNLIRQYLSAADWRK